MNFNTSFISVQYRDIIRFVDTKHLVPSTATLLFFHFHSRHATHYLNKCSITNFNFCIFLWFPNFFHCCCKIPLLIFPPRLCVIMTYMYILIPFKTLVLSLIGRFKLRLIKVVLSFPGTYHLFSTTCIFNHLLLFFDTALFSILVWLCCSSSLPLDTCPFTQLLSDVYIAYVHTVYQFILEINIVFMTFITISL